MAVCQSKPTPFQRFSKMLKLHYYWVILHFWSDVHCPVIPVKLIIQSYHIVFMKMPSVTSSVFVSFRNSHVLHYCLFWLHSDMADYCAKDHSDPNICHLVSKCEQCHC